MSETYHLVCTDCEKGLWVGQGRYSGEDLRVYSSEKHLADMQVFLTEHALHPLIFGGMQRLMAQGIDWVDMDEEEDERKSSRERYHDALTKQLCEQVAASMVPGPDPPYGLKYLVADIEAENRCKDEYLRDRLDEFMQKHTNDTDDLYLYGDAAPLLAVPVSSGEKIPDFGEPKKFL